MGRGKIVWFKTRQRNTVFPVTRAEGVLYGDDSVTVASKLLEHDTEIAHIEEEIVPIANSEIDVIIRSHWNQ